VTPAVAKMDDSAFAPKPEQPTAPMVKQAPKAPATKKASTQKGAGGSNRSSKKTAKKKAAPKQAAAGKAKAAAIARKKASRRGIRLKVGEDDAPTGLE